MIKQYKTCLEPPANEAVVNQTDHDWKEKTRDKLCQNTCVQGSGACLMFLIARLIQALKFCLELF